MLYINTNVIKKNYSPLSLGYLCHITSSVLLYGVQPHYDHVNVVVIVSTFSLILDRRARVFTRFLH